MNPTFQRLMHQATRLTSAGNLQAATAVIQRALGRHEATPAAPVPAAHDVIILDGYVVERAADGQASTPTPTPTHAPPYAPTPTPTPTRPPSTDPSDQGEFLHGTHSHAGLSRDYKLFVPPDAAGRQPALVVMLHGCTQDPDDFAAGTGMNELAREQGFVVLYPAQARSANPSRCWNWFKHNHQGRGCGETGVIAAFEQDLNRSRSRIVADLVQSGAVGLVDNRTADTSIDEVLFKLLREIRRLGATRVVIDSLSGFELTLAPTFREDFRESLSKLVSTLASVGVTVLMTSELEDRYTDLRFSPYGTAFMTDAIIVQRYIEVESRLRRVMAVVKVRSSAHSNELREYRIGSDGIHLGPMLADQEGLLGGKPTHRSAHPATELPAHGAREGSSP